MGKRTDYANPRGLAAVRIKHPNRRWRFQDLEARLCDTHRPDALQAAPPGHGAALPRGAPVDDVQRRRQRTSTARSSRSTRTLQGRLVARARLADRVSRGRLPRASPTWELQGSGVLAPFSMRNGTVVWKLQARPAGRWPPRRRSADANVITRNGRMSCACSTGRATAGSAGGSRGRLADRVLARWSRTASTTSALGTGGFTPST